MDERTNVPTNERTNDGIDDEQETKTRELHTNCWLHLQYTCNLRGTDGRLGLGCCFFFACFFCCLGVPPPSCLFIGSLGVFLFFLYLFEKGSKVGSKKVGVGEVMIHVIDCIELDMGGFEKKNGNDGTHMGYII